ncbi:MAG: hypothetical protein KDA60_04825 [Planctomycetales bacterium]|nr:hypothetical protein [Planctomycetales bacterium]
MSAVRVIPVTTRRQKRQFLGFPWQLYRNDPHWVPPLRLNQKQLVGYARHPFYDDAQVQTFLAMRNGRICGRIAAIVNDVHNRTRQDEQRGFLGFFESENDPTVAHALFDAARGWLADHGQRQLRGPTNPSINYEWGLLIDGFEQSPTFMMTYNPPYYQELWESYGFVKAQDMYSFYGHKDGLEKLSEKVQFVATESARRLNLKLRRVDKRHFTRDVRIFLDIYNKALVGTWGFIPLSESEIVHLAASLRNLIVPDLTLIAEVGDEPVGALFGLLDYNPRIRDINGRLFPFGFLKLLNNRQQIQRVRLISTNVLPEYQRWGVGVVLTTALVEPALAFGVTEGEFSWVLESNHLSRKTLERGGLALEKTHRVYDLIE